ncbi:MAG TPA: PadR family transcriptional regulator [Treponemataceae bacterium]|nr:MAG: lineage-specific thermal regulator protein [Spirochaetes bacterium ADurb.Bin269]HOC29646.1 PadR family transcriptional regulator [Treponemataceae bacterium]HQL32610.1 PadR family transcriptional regulator [Treponemataceae bacterium]
MSDDNIGKDIIRGHIDTIVLTLLSEQDRYGYEVYKEVISRSNGRYELKEPSLYSAFRRLESQGHIRGYWGGESQGGRRKYYAVTDTGRSLCSKSRSEWNAVKKILDTLIGEEE